ncbi:unnamed protein product [Rotaria sordida]|uniref:Uncharacterized protein n=1 Tax=Rotaria sordida TaxID=392033 RepID=A0A818KSE8_9BILA|nr:unnamed protein product [Rotaria sordida]CAF0951424.1 unnamed protein product [Rotaria sordida]CAF3560026.1 unnamed protein product [Rotaria sordida]CAF3565571.1 unnamed protein product [Rotaria sordida]
MRDDYNENCRPQLAAVDSTILYIREAINVLDIQPSSSPFIIADFGSAHGCNSMHVMKVIIQCLKETNKVDDGKQIIVVHNDLPTNNWTTLFDLLNKDNSYHGVANGQSFYEPCLPQNSLSIGYSSTSLHWLSRKPCNILNHCASLFAQGNELKAFQEQARLDWTHFLEHRSHELISGGVLILLIPCVDDQGSNGFDILRELLYKCAQSLLTPQELLDYTFSIHIRSYSECIDDQLFARCSLELIKSDFGSVKMPFIKQWQNEQMTLDEFARSMTLYTRSWSELTLKQALLVNNRSKQDIEQILDQFWSLFNYNARKEFNQLLNICMNYTYLILKKKKRSLE